MVQNGVYDTFAAELTRAVEKMKIGNGLDSQTNIGPLINEEAVNNVNHLINDAANSGARILVGGLEHNYGENFVAPTVLTHVSADMAVAKNEIFGPVAPLIKFDDEEQAISIANDTNVGLASYIYTRDIGRIWRVSEKLEYGMVGINEGIISNEMAPFGGIKESGMGREGSKYGIEDYLEIKYLCMGDLDP